MKFFDDDMDELFNKAGRQYPLKTEPKNWDAVRGAMHGEQGAAASTQNSTRWRRLLPLLLLLLIPAVYIFLDKDNINNETAGQQHISNHNNMQEAADGKNPEIKQNNDNSIGKTEQTFKAPQTQDTKNRTENNTSEIRAHKENHLSNVSPTKQSLSKVVKMGEGDMDIVNDPASWNNIPGINKAFPGLNVPSEVISLNTPVRSLNQLNRSQSVPNSEKKNKYKKGLYYGVIAGPDLSTIKAQSVKGMGYSAGVIVGYTLNDHLEIEAGAMWSRKKYFTDGKYFDKEGAQIPANIKLHWLDGGCEMLEFPVVVRYDLSKKRNTLFGSVGLTSFIMTEEDYKYSAQAAGSIYSYEGYRSYERSGDHLFANLQLSAGYKFSLSPKLNIRIEPYLKTPLKKIGIGKMPITSTGLYFGITRDFR